ncbi:eukaryotic translation initiation factor SUI1 family protein [Trametopsis cervina]|nr:eukaryotic translation initiation factor SUI1 family protein [Trametopsis cervina]
MFKKPLADVKTSAPLRSSDRRRLRQRVVTEFGLPSDEGDLLVPEGLLLQKFSNHVNEPGVVYLSPQGDPLWFTIGKGSEALIPSVYTLWKQPNILPTLTTPAAVIPKLKGGADLMIPGVVQHTSDFTQDQLVSIAQYHRGTVLGYPVAVGRAALSSDELKQASDEDAKGKAVYVLHTWKDFMWDMGSSNKLDMPEPREIVHTSEAPQDDSEDGSKAGGSEDKAAQDDVRNTPMGSQSAQESSQDTQRPLEDVSVPTLPPEDVSFCLRNALLQAISTTLSKLPPSSFPMSASAFWANYVLPTRPAYALGPQGLVDSSAIDIKQSSYKSVKAFLKACAKEGLLKLKENKGDVVVTGIFPAHPAVVGHRPHRTVHSIEQKKEKAEEREKREREEEEKKKSEITVTELWKPFGPTIAWFVAAEKDTSDLFTLTAIREIFNSYVLTKQLVNVHEPQYINVVEDDALARAVAVKNEDTPEFLKRDDALKRVRENMQNWYEVRTDNNDPIQKKGQVKPVSVTVKMRQGRKAVTLITGFELFGLKAEELAEELRRTCSSSTSVAPLQGKTTDTEVLVQGKQVKTVVELLISKGVPKKWIESNDIIKK